MRHGKMVLLAIGVAISGATAIPSGAKAAEAVNCFDNYMLCLNDTSSEDSEFWRTFREAECSLAYIGCMRKKYNGEN